jgi:ABC-type nitrate/sulfonate/bicarbonate transport system ATPase subunit
MGAAHDKSLNRKPAEGLHAHESSLGVSEVIEMTGLAGVATRRVGGFSLGMGQRLGIAAGPVQQVIDSRRRRRGAGALPALR